MHLTSCPGATDLICLRQLVNASLSTALHWMCTIGASWIVSWQLQHIQCQFLIYVSIITVYFIICCKWWGKMEVRDDDITLREGHYFNPPNLVHNFCMPLSITLLYSCMPYLKSFPVFCLPQNLPLNFSIISVASLSLSHTPHLFMKCFTSSTSRLSHSAHLLCAHTCFCWELPLFTFMKPSKNVYPTVYIKFHCQKVIASPNFTLVAVAHGHLYMWILKCWQCLQTPWWKFS